jgi:L-ascorbate metabolism protein UlaG (beta-lactamase superfamily)
MDAEQSGVRWRWFGLACPEMELGEQTLVIDPCFSRFPPWPMLLGRLRPSQRTPFSYDNCRGILVTHSHWDHLLDAPGLALASGATIYGSANTGTLMGNSGVPVAQRQGVQAGEKFQSGDFRVEVLQAEHEKVPLYGVGLVPPGLRPPFEARDYRLDNYFCYIIAAGSIKFMTDPGVNPHMLPEADVLFTQPHRSERYYRRVLDMVKPRLVVPIHWDSLFRYSPRPPLNYWRPRMGWPPLKRVNLTVFASMIKRLSPGAEVIIPEIAKD